MSATPLVMPKRAPKRTWVPPKVKVTVPMPVCKQGRDNARRRAARRNGWDNR